MTLNLIEHAKSLGGVLLLVKSRSKKWTEMAHNNPKEAYKQVMAFGKEATAKMAENKGE